ncbi:hypothetical protein PGTUg99_019500 [Puccinia graminis f. sp. tritici]|uniref:Uncharacterized protein n=1 Tax=Puccinia graminis f. sp. tritici TaxID=56615 RepID=A0A5B0NAY3_PUCGR|nr:hypothetical protein PGTUg99_019500 [Puccinia graminis f. sp. tritici]
MYIYAYRGSHFGQGRERGSFHDPEGFSVDPPRQYDREFQQNGKSNLVPKTPEEQDEEERLKALKNVGSKHFGVKVQEIDATLNWIKSLRESIYEGNLTPEIMANSPIEKLGAVGMWRKFYSMKKFLTFEGLIKFRSDFETELKLIKVEDTIHSLHPELTKTELKYFKKFVVDSGFKHAENMKLEDEVETIFQQWMKSKKTVGFYVSKFWEKLVNGLKSLGKKENKSQ